MRLLGGDTQACDDLIEKIAAGTDDGTGLGGLERVDVVERSSQKVLYQWYLCDCGSGCIFPNGETHMIAHVIQHGLEILEEVPEDFVRSLAGAYSNFAGKIEHFVDFRDLG